MNTPCIIIFAVLAVVDAAICGLVIVDLLFNLNRYSWTSLACKVMVAIATGSLALFAGTVALSMAAAALAGAP